MNSRTREARRTFHAVVVFCAAFVATALALTGCAAGSAWGDDVNRALNGVEATMTTYDQDGARIDQVTGTSFRVSRDEKFDSSASDGSSNKDSQVLLISVGSSHISHVGSSLILAEKGLTEVTSATNTVDVTNSDAGRPWLNDLIEKNRNLWQGKAKTLLIRSQSGAPIAVFVGAQVEAFATDVPKSTAFRVDGKYLFVYRCDYTIYDSDLLG